MSEDSRFTDQMYEGSNLNILIDLVAYMYQCLMYQLNNAASESMFSDTQIYENINRLVNLLGYNPKGCSPAAIQANIEYNGTDEVKPMVYKYTYFDTGKVDSKGKQICFSIPYNEDESIDTESFDNDSILTERFVNGRYRIYPQIFESDGTENWTIPLGMIRSDAENGAFVAHNYIDVYVETGDELRQWKRDNNGIFNNTSNINEFNTENSFYGHDDEVYSIRLNEDKQYEIRFGDGIIGKKPEKGSKIIVMYLDSNGKDGEISPYDMDFGSMKLKHSPQDIGIDAKLYDKMFPDASERSITKKDYTLRYSTGSVSEFIPEEGVEDIRSNAPRWFKTGNRLITAEDYEYYVMNNKDIRNIFSGNGNIADVKCMNNTQFMATFYKWLYINGKRRNDPKHYFNQQFWNRGKYKAVDPADCNNTYLWIKTNNPNTEFTDEYDPNEKHEEINRYMKPIKTMTTEIQVVKPVMVNYCICANTNYDDVTTRYISDKDSRFDIDNESYIEITIDDDMLYVNTSIRDSVAQIILDAFSVSNCRLGQTVDISDILERIYQISGVKNIRTIYKKDGSQRIILDGLSFASWSPILDDDKFGIDLHVGNSSRRLEQFQFPRYIESKDNLINRMVIIKKTLVAVNSIKQ